MDHLVKEDRSSPDVKINQMSGLDGVGITNYRSFGLELQRIGPLAKLNLLIGQNNVGKSNILNFFANYYAKLVLIAQGKAQDLNFSPELDAPNSSTPTSWTFEIGLKIDGASYKERMASFVRKNCKDQLSKVVENILRSNSLTKGTSVAWFKYHGPWGRGVANIHAELVDSLETEKVASRHEWQELFTALAGKTGGELKQHWIPEVLQILSPAVFTPPPIILIPAIRVIGAPGTTPHDFSGVGIIDRLAELQHPPHHKQGLKQQFTKINAFVQWVLDDPMATLEIPHDKSAVLVNKDNRNLPLQSLGTGLHEVITLGVAATVLEGTLLCIEEPELHLHPILQKKLIRYLIENTSNSYLIATHSAHLLDTPGANIFHVRLVSGTTTVESASTNTAASSICDDLGYRPSDLLQSNCIIWVEGPSDRIYLNHWIHALDRALLEGLHYSIMFYGGRLLSHLTAADQEVEGFISLRRLNRHMIVVLDSDKSNENDDLNETKNRITKEFTDGVGFAWITQGREIENYIDSKLLEKCLHKTHPQFHTLGDTGIYDHVYQFKKKDGSIAQMKDVDKVKLAHSVAQQPPELDIMDLRKMATHVVNFICQSNGTQ